MVDKKMVFIISVLVFLFSAFSTYSFFSGEKTGSFSFISPISKDGSEIKQNNSGTKEEIIDKEPKTEECPINGKMMTKTQRSNWEKKRPLGIMIENHLKARPQSGLSSADVIYEAVAEGGITRFMSIFYCQDAPIVGPVRSARIYFVSFLEEYGTNPLYAHVGGANCDEESGTGCANGAKADSLGKIRKLGWGLYNDLNQFAVPFPYYWRDYERLPNVATEHTVYSSTKKLWDYASTKRKLSNIDEDGVAWDKNFDKWQFKDDELLDKRGQTNKIDFSFWSSFESDFSVSWSYDKKNNSYKRVNAGKPHLDKNNSKQLEAKNVVIVFADEAPANDGYPGGHILYDIIGKDKVLIFQDGKAIEGTWKKVDEESRMKFFNDSEKEISLVRGQVFIEILPSGNKVSY